MKVWGQGEGRGCARQGRRPRTGGGRARRRVPPRPLASGPRGQRLLLFWENAQEPWGHRRHICALGA